MLGIPVTARRPGPLAPSASIMESSLVEDNDGDNSE
jgi:hypothetical protein